MKFVGSQTVRERQKILKVARKFAPVLSKESKEQEIAVKVAIEQKFADNQQRKIDRQITAKERSSKLFDSLSEDGGHCKTSLDVDDLLSRLKSRKKSKSQITESFKNQISFQKTVLNRKNLKMGTLDFMIQSLKYVLSNDNSFQED
ncbi:hypothetical protein ElyMa_005618600 [Elysia marginata]|uniref:Uncharacterized protein n=1 Tax=Elysia marginata TaxID=1093978 RepID=A0AAV4F7D4_9GAST|nr:hypothetical protein ElyMa_005618600 [Elysia marginata]